MYCLFDPLEINISYLRVKATSSWGSSLCIIPCPIRELLSLTRCNYQIPVDQKQRFGSESISGVCQPTNAAVENVLKGHCKSEIQIVESIFIFSMLFHRKLVN